jgi:hypothetical protein
MSNRPEEGEAAPPRNRLTAGRRQPKEKAMEGEKKSSIRKALELLEDNGFYVFKAEEDLDLEGGCSYPWEGAIKLEMVPKEVLKNNK